MTYVSEKGRNLDVVIAKMFYPDVKWIPEDDPWCNEQDEVLAPNYQESLDDLMKLKADKFKDYLLDLKEFKTKKKHFWVATLVGKHNYVGQANTINQAIIDAMLSSFRWDV